MIMILLWAIGVLGINPRRNALMQQKIGFAVFLGALAFVQNHLNFYASFLRVHKSLCYWRGRERIRAGTSTVFVALFKFSTTASVQPPLGEKYT